MTMALQDVFIGLHANEQEDRAVLGGVLAIGDIVSVDDEFRSCEVRFGVAGDFANETTLTLTCYLPFNPYEAISLKEVVTADDDDHEAHPMGDATIPIAPHETETLRSRPVQWFNPETTSAVLTAARNNARNTLQASRCVAFLPQGLSANKNGWVLMVAKPNIA